MGREAGGRVAPPAAAPNGPDLERRLRQIERLGLAQREGDGVWRVPMALREALDGSTGNAPSITSRYVPTRGPSTGRSRLAAPPGSIGSIRRPSLPTVWAASCGPSSNGAPLRRQPDDPQRLAKLLELERRAVGERMAASLGLELLAEPPAHFRGRVVVAPGTPGVALVSDGSRAHVGPRSVTRGSPCDALSWRKCALAPRSGLVLPTRPRKGPTTSCTSTPRAVLMR
jgi:hypothetical protein